ncbi:hypothetical protein LASUN_03770 [Lentilactobacillus sunkii]|jgi:hypothetical protein|uniref:TPM domain-containing protein n=1 Tax=Lentilactobacillus sunkii TaxID=481719 RepID=A0A1E7XIB6_9LACO|nr:hypothetical protein [Lentilactobacillus sunkii]OFA12854.1 hypothetical protein LASUN_03770 [Lentilactobacillus sunkii]
MMRGHHLTRYFILLLTFFSILVSVKSVHAAPRIKPVIYDSLHLLTPAEKEHIKDVNKKLKKNKLHQQIWVITLNKPGNTYSFYMDYNSTEDEGLSLNTLNDDAASLTDYISHKFIKYNNDSDLSTRQLISDRVNIVLVDPSLKYKVIPITSQTFHRANGEVRNLLISPKFDFQDMSGKNIINTVDVLDTFINQHLNSEDLSPGLFFSDVDVVIFGLIIVLIITWHHYWRKKHPKRIRWEDPDSPRNDPGYDNGYMDGYYIGMHEDDGKDK